MNKTRLATLLRLCGLVITVGLVWAWGQGRLSPGTWTFPLKYRGDAVQVLGWIQAASEGDYLPFWSATVTRLGAPYQANWNDYPMYERVTIGLLGIVAKLFGLFAAANFGVLLGHLLSAISFYACCRFLKGSIIWSFVGALLFSFTYYHFFRGLQHLFLAFSFPVPWAILSCWLVASSKRLRLGNRLWWVCLITALCMGLGNPYNLNFYLQLLGLSILAQFVRSRRWENLRVGLLSAAVAGAAFLAINVGTLAYGWAHGKNPDSLERLYLESELYALKPIEFFIPPPSHHLKALAQVSTLYQASAYVKGELFSPYLGVIVAAGLIWMFSESFCLLARNSRRRRPFPPYALQSAWILFCAAIGGFNCMLSFCGWRLFRSTNRASIFISAIVLLFLVSRLSRCSRRLSPKVNACLAIAVLLIGTWDQTPRPPDAEKAKAIQQSVQSDRDFGRNLEQRLPHASMIFQLPVMAFMDAPNIREVTGYEMLRPYFFTKTLRFSFGSVRGRTREAWQWEVEKMPVPQMVDTLEQYGFSAIYINRNGYADHATNLLNQLAAASCRPVLEDDVQDQVCVALKPAPVTSLPHTDDRADVRYRGGWAVHQHTPLESRAWSHGDALLSFYSEPSQVTAYSFRCQIGSLSARRVSIEMDGQELWSAAIAAKQSVPVALTVYARHGNNKVYFKTDAEPTQTKDAVWPRAFIVIDLQITKLPG
jgi:phosphoglycerol transferase